MVARVWSSAGYETGIDRRDGRTYVIARSEERTALIRVVALGPDHQLTRGAVDRFCGTLASVAVDEAYLVTDAKVPLQTREAAEDNGIAAVDGANLRQLARESGVLAVRDASDARTRTDDATVTAAGAGDGANAAAPSDPEAESDDHGPEDWSAAIEDRPESPDRTDVTPDEADTNSIPEAESDDGESDAAVDTNDAGNATTRAEEPTADSADDGDGGGGGDTGRSIGRSDRGTSDEPVAVGGSATDGGSTDESGRSRRTILAAVGGTVGATLTAGILDWAWLHVLFGGGSRLPSYNETRVKRMAASVPVERLVGNAESMIGTPVTYEAILLGTRTENGLTYLRLAVGRRGHVVIGRWDGQVPGPGVRLEVWGVFRRLTAPSGSESEGGGAPAPDVPLVDVVDLRVIADDGDASLRSDGRSPSGGSTDLRRGHHRYDEVST